MPPKRKVKSSKASEAKKPKMSDELPKLNENSPVLYIECCRSCTVFKRRAEALHREVINLLTPLKSDLNLQLSINSEGSPRRGSFEVSIATAPSSNGERPTLIWTGLKNTPRAAKFPTPENIAEYLKQYLKFVHAVSDKKKENEDKPSKDDAETRDRNGKPSSKLKGGRSRTKK